MQRDTREDKSRVKSISGPTNFTAPARRIRYHLYEVEMKSQGLTIQILLDQVVSFPRMVYILDGCSFHVAHVWCKQGLFSKKIEFNDSFDVTKCLEKNRKAWFTPCVRIVKWATIYYKNHEIGAHVQKFLDLNSGFDLSSFHLWIFTELIPWLKIADPNLISRDQYKSIYINI